MRWVYIFVWFSSLYLVVVSCVWTSGPADQDYTYTESSTEYNNLLLQ